MMVPKKTKVRLINLKYVSKLCSSNQTGLLSSSYLQTYCSPVFSGTRTQHFEERFFEQLSKKIRGSSAGKRIPELHSALNKILADLETLILEDGKRIHLHPDNSCILVGLVFYYGFSPFFGDCSLTYTLIKKRGYQLYKY